MEITAEQFEAATKRMDAKRARHSTVVAAHYDADIGRLVIELANGLELSFSPDKAQELHNATAEDLSEIEITGSELAVYFPRIDASVYVPGLLAGIFGTKEWMHTEFARLGGKTTRDAKAEASREDGKLGGRPRKNKAAL